MMEQRKRIRSKPYPKPVISLEELKAEVLSKAGITAINHLRFEKLAGMIYEHTYKRLSVTTLKRVYGFAERKHNLSGYTLSVLAEFSRAQQLKKTA